MVLVLFAFTDLLPVKREQKLIMFLVSYIILVLFAGLRYFPNQQDFGEYSGTFTGMVKSPSFDYIFEPGYVLLMWLVSCFTDSYAVFFMIVASIAVGLNFAAIKRYMPRYLFLAILFYFVHTFIMREMGAIRAGLAAGICAYGGLQYVKQRRFLPYCLVTLFAMCFHLSAVAFFLVYPIYRCNWSPRTMLYLIILCIVIGTVMPIGKLMASLPMTASISRLAGYAKDLSSSLGIWTNPTTLKQLVFSIAGLLFYKRIECEVPWFRIILVPYVISVCWLMLWNDFPIIAGRMAMFYSITEIFLVPCFLCIFTPLSRPIVLGILVLLAFAILYLNGITFLTPESGYFPYRTIFVQ